MKRLSTAVLIVALIALFADMQRAPADQWSARAAVTSIHLYQATLSKWYASVGVQCRFQPTCSHYGEDCIRRFGAARGSWMAMKRVLRCGPWTPMGTVDAPPVT